MLVRVAAARAALLVLLLSAGGAIAQQPSAEAIATAKELITVKGGSAIYEPVIPGVVEQVKSVFLRTNPMLGKDLNEVANKVRSDLASRTAELVNDAAKVYAGRFTEKELKDALAFYKSPLGRKLINEEANILDQSMRNAQNWANRLSEEVMSKMRAEMRKRGHDI
ncbi:MAG: DUF2059 domain-containing protein [Hyphomicrobiales bacterium]|nr:DUF2059 domain-containing protein [Hyphomicrobiales bacterium]